MPVYIHSIDHESSWSVDEIDPDFNRNDLKDCLSEHPEMITDDMYNDIDLDDGEFIAIERIVVSDFEKQEDFDETIRVTCQLKIYYTTD